MSDCRILDIKLVEYHNNSRAPTFVLTLVYSQGFMVETYGIEKRFY